MSIYQDPFFIVSLYFYLLLYFSVLRFHLQFKINFFFFENGQTFEFSKDLIFLINQHIDSQKYVIVLHQTKKTNQEIKPKI